MGPILHSSHSHIFLPSDFAVCPVKEADSIFLLLGFEFSYVTCFGQWNISRSKGLEGRLKAWKALENEAHLVVPLLLP